MEVGRTAFIGPPEHGARQSLVRQGGTLPRAYGRGLARLARAARPLKHGGAAFPPLGTSWRVGSAVSSGTGIGLRLGAGRLDDGQGPQNGSRVPTAEGLGRSRDGFSTKEPAVVDARGNCLQWVLTPGEAADSPQLPALLAALPEQPDAVVADKHTTPTVCATR